MMLDTTAEFIQKWLAQPMAERDVPAAAEVLLKLNRNKILYGNIVLRPEKFHDKLEYELRKHLQIYLDHQTAKKMVAMEDQLMPKVEKTFSEDAYEDVANEEDKRPSAEFADVHYKSRFAGLRDDHEELPDEIRDLYDKNGDIYFRMKALHGKLKTMSNAPVCDRYEFLKELECLYQQYRENWNRYDHFSFENYHPEADKDDKDDPSKFADKVSAARKYISSNVKKVEKALEEGKEEEADKWLPKIQERIHFLTENKQTFDADYQQKLVSLGLEV